MSITVSSGISFGSGTSITTNYLSPGGSVFIQGSLGQYINIPKTIANSSTLLGDHTIEFWYYQTSYNTANDVIWSNSAWYPATSNINYKSRYILTAGSVGNMVLTFGILSYNITTISFTAPSLNNWHHVAISRRNGITFIYVDSIYKGTNANVIDVTGPLGNMTLGDAVSGFNGYISNFRIVNSRALYTGTTASWGATVNFPLPTQPLTTPPATSASGSTSSLITITTVAPLNNKAVTYEFWYYNSKTIQGNNIGAGGVFNTTAGASGNTSGVYFYIGGSATWNLQGGSQIGFGGGGSYPSNKWQHVALVTYPASGTMYMYLDGALYVGTTFTGGTLTSTNIYLGGPGDLIAGFRYTIGATLYTGASLPLPITAPPATQAGQPNGVGGSAQFSGANGLTITGDANTEIGSQDFTWECWVFVPAATVGLQTFISQRSGGTGFWFGLNTSGLAPNVWYGSTQIIQANQSIGTNSWQHVAFTRQAGITSVFINGIFGSRTNNPTGEPTNQNFGIGRDLDATKGLTGFISNVRVTVGQVLYTQTTLTASYNSFWPMTPENLVPFTAGDKTELLLTMSSSGALLTDSSANNFTVTNVGSVTYSSTNPFVWNTQICMPMTSSATLLTDTSGSAGNTISGGTWAPVAPWLNDTQLVLRTNNSSSPLADSGPYALTLANNGQTSGFFNGSNQYLTVANNAAFDFTTATNFTIEAWILIAQYTVITGGGSPTIFSAYPTSGTPITGYSFSINASGFLVFSSVLAGVTQTITATNNSVSLNTWTHVAVTRSGATYRMFVNGVLVTTTGTMNQNVNSGGNAIDIGALNYTSNIGYWPGLISNVRVTSGALYTAGFTPSTTPLTTTVSSGTVVLLLPLNAVPFTDISANTFTVTNVGTTTLASSSPFTQVTTAATYSTLSPYTSPAPVMDLQVAPATATVGTVWPDASGNGNNGTLTGNNAFMSRISTNGGGIRLATGATTLANASYITTPYAINTTSFTISMVYSLQATGSSIGGLWCNSNVTGLQGYRAVWNNTAIDQIIANIGGSQFALYPVYNSAGTVLLNTVHEITFVVSPSLIVLYSNGQAFSGSPPQNGITAASGFAANTLLFGANRPNAGTAPTASLGCTLYNMRVYNTVLTPAQVKANFDQYRSIYGI